MGPCEPWAVDARRRALTHSPRPPRPPSCCSLNSWPCRSWRVARVIAKKLWRVICCAYLPNEPARTVSAPQNSGSPNETQGCPQPPWRRGGVVARVGSRPASAQARSLSEALRVFWVDGIHVQARLEDAAQCLLVIIGATPEGKKELVGLIDGVRESAQSWRELLLDLKRRGLAMGPELAVADGALGFWQAIEEVWPQTRGQRCWVHKTANVLNKLPKSQQSKAKRALQEIWMAEIKKDALAAFDAFVETWGVKYDKAVECLVKDRAALLAFYDFPAEHWKHLRTTNVVESSFATVRHRTVRSKGCLSNKTALAMIFKLAEAAERSWRRLDGHNQLPKVILGVKFTDGIEVVRSQAQTAAA